MADQISHSAPAPASKTQALRTTGELHRGAMNRLEAFSSSVAAIAPAGSILIVFGAIVAPAGIGSGLVLLVATIAFAFHINTVAQYNRVSPSPGFYVSYVARAFNVTTATVTAALYGVGEVILLGVAIFGPALWDQEVIKLLSGYAPPWWLMILVQGVIGIIVVASGVVFSVRVIASLFAFEVVTILIGVVAILATHASYIPHSGAAFAPSNITSGSGFGAAFTLCILIFTGCSASAPMSDEMANPRKNIPIAVFTAVGVAGFLYILAMWAQVVGYSGHVGPMLKTDFPFITAAAASGGWVKYLLYASGLTSGLAVTLATLNACSRLYFNMSRERLLPHFFSGIWRRRRTPWNAIAIVGVASVLIMIFYTAIAAGWSYNAGYTGYSEIATLGTDLVIVVYIMINVGLPFFARKHAPELFSWSQHVVAPILATLILLYPLWESVKPDQPAPYGWFWTVVVAVIVLGLIGGIVASRRGLPVGEYESSEVEHAGK